MSSKGQVFIIGSVIIVLVLVMIRAGADVSEILDRKSFIESGLERQELDNIRKELPKSGSNAINDTSNIANATNSFVSFAEGRLSARTVDLDGVTVGSLYEDLPASTDTPLNVTFYNFFDSNISSAVLNFSSDFGSPVTLSDVAPGETRETSFTINVGSDQDMVLWVYYQTPSGGVTENVTIPAEIGRTKFVGYYDVRMTGERGDVRDRFSQVLPVR